MSGSKHACKRDRRRPCRSRFNPFRWRLALRSAPDGNIRIRYWRRIGNPNAIVDDTLTSFDSLLLPLRARPQNVADPARMTRYDWYLVAVR